MPSIVGGDIQVEYEYEPEWAAMDEEAMRRGDVLKEGGGEPELSAKYREGVENKTRERTEAKFRDINPEDLSGGFFKDYTEK